jgi:hypothetical protein
VTQYAFRRYIEERVSIAESLRDLTCQLDQHHSRFQSSRAVSPSVDSKEELESMKSIVLLFSTFKVKITLMLGKLREGVTAAHRIDAFAIEGSLKCCATD